jgi:hypothetical protein
MDQYTPFSSRASMAALSVRFRDMWAEVEKRVHIRQKTISYDPIDKLLLATLNILAGGQGIVEINTRLRCDAVFLKAFGCDKCADQSVVSETLNACDAENVAELRGSLRALLIKHGQCTQHHEQIRTPLLLDIDLTGLLAGRQGEGVTKGYFSDHKGARGRQLARVLATDYDEIVCERLYAGNRQLKHVLDDVLDELEQVLQLTPEGRARTILRVDAGAGSDADIDKQLTRGYLLLTKVTSSSRSRKLAESVTSWHQDPKEHGREWGWPEASHEYVRETRQVVVRKKHDGKWRYRALVSNLDDETLCRLARQPVRRQVTDIERLFLIAHAYDLRSGGVETSNRGSKSGLGIMKRNKKRFSAQEMLVLLAELVYNFLTWTRNLLAQTDERWARYGPLRMVRDVGQIAGVIYLPQHRGQRLQIILNGKHPLASRFVSALSIALTRDLLLILGKT